MADAARAAGQGEDGHLNEVITEGAETVVGSEELLARILASPDIDRIGFCMSLWSLLYTGPAFAEMESRLALHRDENNVLFCLAHYGQLTAKNISEFLCRPKNSISRAIERLLKKQLIHTETDPRDKRRILLTIEESGRALYAESSRLWREREALLLAQLTATERVALDAILSKMLANARLPSDTFGDDAEA